MRRVLGGGLCIIFISLGVRSARDWWWIFTDENKSVIVVYGFGSVWASVSGIIMFGALLLLLMFFNMKWIDKHAHIVAVVTAFICSPIIAGVVTHIIDNKSAGFTECKELRNSSRFHSSKTYAITPLHCDLLVHGKSDD